MSYSYLVIVTDYKPSRQEVPKKHFYFETIKKIIL